MSLLKDVHLIVAIYRDVFEMTNFKRLIFPFEDYSWDSGIAI